ncbi:MAG TPA: FecR family protein [Gammaproteobacteria bacterium]|nr:FecR family protein [Gammaproteobacteria bacterium]
MQGLRVLSSVVAAILAAVCLGAAAAEPPAGSVVTAVQSPAWRVQGSFVAPLRPGDVIEDGNSLRTGAGGRVYLALPEASTVKLGENTELATPAMDMMQDREGSLFKGALHILKGVFRFTTSLIGKSRRRQVDIQVGTATIGIRGTDVWGRAGPDGQLVALLEGKAEMHAPGHAMMMMDQPMHYMLMPNAGAMQMHLPVTQANLADWAAQTDVHPGSGVLSRDGHWVLSLISSTDARDTTRLMRILDQAGYPSEVLDVTVRGRNWHRLVIRQVASHADARALAARLGATYPLMSPWIYRDSH